MFQECRCATFEGQTVQGARCAVGVCVACGEDGGDEEGVDDVGEDGDAHVRHRDDIGRGSCGAAARGDAGDDSDELWVVVGNDDAGTKGSDDEEDAKTPVDCFEGGFDVDAWAFGFGSDHGDILRADDAEGCRPEASEEAFKFA